MDDSYTGGLVGGQQLYETSHGTGMMANAAESCDDTSNENFFSGLRL